MNVNFKRLCTMLMAVTAASIQAQVLSTTSNVNYLASPPASVQQGALESNDVVTLFQENTARRLESEYSVNVVGPGLYDQNSDLPAGPQTLSAGTWVDSYFLSSDRLGATGSTLYEGSIVFNQRILGVALLQPSLDSSDTLGSAATIYPTGYSARNMELDPATEWLRLSPDMKQLDFKFTTYQRVDQMRIFTATTVPEPGSAVFLLTGLGSLLALRVKRQAK
jgi:hypothetical protein